LPQGRQGEVRRAAVVALGAIKDADSVPALLDCLKDNGVEIRRAAVGALGSIKHPGSVPALLDCLKEDTGEIRLAAAEALGTINDPRAVPALMHCLKDDSEEVRRAASGALAQAHSDDIRRLVSRYVDGSWPWLDPQVPIGAARVAKVASRTTVSKAAVRSLYEEIAPGFGLTLRW
jgi:HEAT repeat protein